MKRFETAETDRDRDTARKQLRTNLAGKLGETIAKDAMGPFSNGVETHKPVHGPNGLTYIDIRTTGARGPIILGREQGIAQGGNLSVEVKVGEPDYIRRQLLGHVPDVQVEGHLALGDKSLVLVPADMRDVCSENELRQSVRESGSYVMAVLPSKEMINRVLETLLKESVRGA